MNKLICFAVAAILVTSVTKVNGQEKFIPAHSIPGTMSPGAAAGIEDPRNQFVKVYSKRNVTKWAQSYDGIPIYGSVLTTHNDEKGQINRVQGFASQTAGLVDTKPLVESSTATEKIKKRWNHKEIESNLDLKIEDPKLMILSGDDGWDRLVWKVSYTALWKSSPPADIDVKGIPGFIVGFVNAHTEDIEDTWNNIQDSNIRAIVGNEHIGASFVNIDVQQSSATCKHRDESRRIEVFHVYNEESVAKADSAFTCGDADEEDWDMFKSTRAYSPRNEVYHHASQFVDLWRAFTGTDPHRYSSHWLRFYVHYGYRYENAFFDGDSFKFGDGQDIFYPLTSLDVVCHEIGHSITEWHGAGLEYRYQSGGMNEAYSDVLGATCAAHYYGKLDGRIGEDIMKPGNWLGTAMRDMCNPSSIGSSLDHFSKYRWWTEVHSSSGIYNKAWCTLVNTRGWNYQKVFEVFTDANMLYWTPRSTMHCGACGVESAAEDNGYSKDDVAYAFEAVGVYCSKC